MSEKMISPNSEMQRVVAEVRIEFCKAPAERGVNKLAEGAVEASVKKNGRYREAISNQISAEFEYEMVNPPVKAIDARKAALENLVRLYEMGRGFRREAPSERSGGTNRVQ